MRHVSEADLLAFASGELSDAKHREIEAHVSTCAACRRAQAETASVQGLLDEWDVDGADRDAWPAIERRLGEPASVGVPRRWHVVARMSRIAAAVLLGVGLGHAAGRLTWRRGPIELATTTPTHATAAFEHAAADELALYVLESPSSAGLFKTVLELTDASRGEEGRP
jgi:anti-sigma factor RsiW